jgi:nicotinamide mononucleotide adenylyltransferase
MRSARMAHRGAVEVASGVEGLGARDEAGNAFTPSGGHESAPEALSQEGHVASVNCWCRPVRDEEEPTVWVHSDSVQRITNRHQM